MSEVVVTVLLILITIVAIALLSQFILPFVMKKLNTSTECLSYKDYFNFEENFVLGASTKNYNCYSIVNEALYIGVSVKTLPVEKDVKDKVKGFALVFESSSGSKSVEVNPQVQPTADFYMFGALNAPYLEVPTDTETITYVYHESTSTPKYTTIEVYPVLKSGRICEASDKIEIKPCINVILA